ncbi:MAG: hypothetical protein HY730_00650 [Candidatus Tectomicrobia bacterium]|uniref:DsrE/DsrF-like family protein n=1 Tax=Tectimicrobiota bacterium TaxID=2528274 RepID=A0A933LPP6_UNCTE|nr:hypothetical protein [Candidatus Tectomicrobia bacterium]
MPKHINIYLLIGFLLFLVGLFFWFTYIPASYRDTTNSKKEGGASMDLLLICRDASASSLLGNLMVAAESKKSGTEVGILFTEGALEAVCRGVFLWPIELQGMELRLRIADNGKAQGFPIMARGEGRQIDVMGFLNQLKGEGIPMFACPGWLKLLGLQSKLPAGIQELDMNGAAKLMNETKRVIGSF